MNQAANLHFPGGGGVAFSEFCHAFFVGSELVVIVVIGDIFVLVQGVAEFIGVGSCYRFGITFNRGRERCCGVLSLAGCQ